MKIRKNEPKVNNSVTGNRSPVTGCPAPRPPRPEPGKKMTSVIFLLDNSHISL